VPVYLSVLSGNSGKAVESSFDPGHVTWSGCENADLFKIRQVHLNKFSVLQSFKTEIVLFTALPWSVSGFGVNRSLNQVSSNAFPWLKPVDYEGSIA